MKSYTIYLKDKSDPVTDAIYLSEGFSFAAAFFNVLWLFYNRLWLQTILFAIMSMCVLEIHRAYITDSFTTLVAFVMLWVYIGFNGKDYLRKRLENEGYKMVDIIISNSDEEAEFRFISKFLKNLSNE